MEQDLDITEPFEEIQSIIDVRRSTYWNILPVTLAGDEYSTAAPILTPMQSPLWLYCLKNSYINGFHDLGRDRTKMETNSVYMRPPP